MNQSLAQPRHRLRRRLMLVFAAYSISIAAVFALYALAFAYTTEDAFFSAQLAEEVIGQRNSMQRTGQWRTPLTPGMHLYTNPGAMPEDLRAVVRAEPDRIEVAGNAGRYYHLATISDPHGRMQAWLVYEVSARLVVRPMRGQWLSLLAWTAVGMTLLALAIGAWLAHRIAAPLSRLSDTVARLQAENLSECLPHADQDDEVGVLARGLEALMQRIRDFIERERHFTRDASHELRTPLAVIRSAAERITGDPGLTDTARQQLGHIRHSAYQLEQVIATLLSMAREEDIEPAKHMPLLAMVERVIVEQSLLPEERTLAIDIDLPATHRVLCPRGVLHILLSNLIGNAFAHGTQGTIRIDLHEGRLRIANQGHSIPADLREHLYAPHRKREGSAGFGLGLSIAQRLCERHGISLVVEHDDESGETRALVGFAGDVIGTAPM